MVRVHAGPLELYPYSQKFGAIAQLGERLVCNQEVVGSIPASSTNFLFFENWELMSIHNVNRLLQSAEGGNFIL